ncbi:SDR family NAD(P)-dependent oxidoreductase [Arthrobacter sp. MI7-26]|uniref:SDR family NAD(P)-dependent oxidoreductase n=1 Tax=Arthrobacter sp. MI7-26 TaxID=2993653 RepID=UPI0022494A72|nr:SDR family oxidoreductase [Arthrobacter sp. MI7-26]MCX2748054.1 SDR family NAD(P)-dependent oxidoreductase [Arthrobacter sp. MI7-26]
MKRNRQPPVAAITGGASGIGLEFARRWIAGGGSAVLLDLSQPTLDIAIAELDYKARGVVVDVTDNASVLAGYRSIGEIEGRLDAVVNSAGIARPGPSSNVSDEDFTLMLDIHITGTMRSCRAAYPLLRDSGGGTIVNLASVAAISGMPGRASYTTAKAGIAGLTRTLAVEWAPEGIRVNAVGPGYVRTAMTDSLVAEGKLDDAPIKARTPLGRFAEPAEIAEAIYFLSTPSSSYVSGHLLMVDGGMTVDGNWFQ